MGSIKATYSAVGLFASDCRTGYSALIATAEDIHSRDAKILEDVFRDYEALGRQISRAENLRSEAHAKIRFFQSQAAEAHAEAQSADAEARYIESHPDESTSTDSDGNTTTTYHVDTAAVRAAERRRDEALQREKMYLEKKRETESILSQIESTIHRFTTVRAAIGKVGESIEADMYQIKKYINAMNDEAEYNSVALENVLKSLGEYLASRKIFIPEPIKYGSFAPKGASASASSGGGSSSASFTAKEPEAGSTDSQGGDETVDIDKISSGNLSQDDLKGTPESPSILPKKTKTVKYKRLKAADDYDEDKYSVHSSKESNSLNYRQKMALTEYSREGYTKMNKHLRGIDPEFINESDKAMTLQNIAEVKSAISGMKLPKNMNLYRGVYNPTFMLGSDWSTKSLSDLRSDCIGTVFLDKGFCSTSIDRQVAVDFAMKEKGVVVEIVAPKGAEGLFMKDTSVYAKEKEVLLQQGSCFKITGINFHPQTGYVIQTQLIGRTK